MLHDTQIRYIHNLFLNAHDYHVGHFEKQKSVYYNTLLSSKMHIIVFAFWENTNSQHFVVLQSAHHTTFNTTCIIIPFIFMLFLHTYASLANFFLVHIYIIIFYYMLNQIAFYALVVPKYPQERPNCYVFSSHILMFHDLH